MSAQEDICWRCATAWVAELAEPQAALPEDEPRAALRLIEGGAAPVAAPASTAQRLARLRAEARA